MVHAVPPASRKYSLPSHNRAIAATAAAPVAAELGRRRAIPGAQPCYRVLAGVCTLSASLGRLG